MLGSGQGLVQSSQAMPCIVLVAWLPNPTLIHCLWSAKAHKASGKLIARHCCAPPQARSVASGVPGKMTRASIAPARSFVGQLGADHRQVLQPALFVNVHCVRAWPRNGSPRISCLTAGGRRMCVAFVFMQDAFALHVGLLQRGHACVLAFHGVPASSPYMLQVRLRRSIWSCTSIAARVAGGLGPRRCPMRPRRFQRRPI